MNSSIQLFNVDNVINMSFFIKSLTIPYIDLIIYSSIGLYIIHTINKPKPPPPPFISSYYMPKKIKMIRMSIHLKVYSQVP